MPRSLKPKNPIYTIINGYNAATKSAFCPIFVYAPLNWDENASKRKIWTVEGCALDGIHVDCQGMRQARLAGTKRGSPAVVNTHSNLNEAVTYLTHRCQTSHLLCRMKDEFLLAQPAGNRYYAAPEQRPQSSCQRCGISGNIVDTPEELPCQSHALYDVQRNSDAYDAIWSWTLDVWWQSRDGSIL
ncbi:hypothetical protein DFH06DRAFT_1174474 [Mycena polygramma]|nr:hypothetical protein DFH06DRAFT_1174474 [Mycena polygramma]